MNVEIINVGTELLLGEIINTNATFLQKMCKDLGFNVYFQTVVGDNSKRLYDCLDLAFKRGADCVITTGGLGPTTDDLTKELSAQYLGLEMVYHEKEAEKVYKKCCYITGNSQIPENNFKQAYYPKDAYILENMMGTANGCIMHKDEKMIINLPGPPKEMTYVVEHSLIPYLKQYKQDKIYTFEYTTIFIGESQVDEVLRDIIEKQNQVSVALYAGEETVRVRLAVKTSSKKQADVLMEPIKKEIEQRLDSYIVDISHIKETLLKMNVSLSVEYKGDFHFKDELFQPFLKNQSQVHIIVETVKEDLGEVIIFHFNDDYVFQVPTFMKAELSYGKVETRFILQLYKYIRQNVNK